MLDITLLDIRQDLTVVKDHLSEFVAQQDVSYFNSWSWIENWITMVPIECPVHLALVYQDEELQGAFFVGVATIKRSKLFNVKQLVVNATGHSEYDRIWIEYNQIFCAPGAKLDLGSILKKIPLKWDEVCLPGLDSSAFPADSLSTLSSPFSYVADEVTVSPYVDLEKVRQTDGDYLSLLSSNTRSQIRRSFRVLEKIGPVELEVPDELDHGFAIYYEMVSLHQIIWEERGEAGVFSSQLFNKFHERLIHNCFDKGEIQLLRIHAGGSTVGCLYNFLWQRRIYFYQCGFNYSFGKKVQPGLVSHVLAVQYNSEQGYNVYDFLAGDARYKKSLATDYNKMSWGRIQRFSWKLKMEKKMRDLFLRH
ncbi:MAG: GNAT family N-acetyltransferase [Candidatus Electrothrix sp. GM3_4]|nr:GNAT family N-acetyltransferase [Candidatus Electrothrix sp. GM3_4]